MRGKVVEKQITTHDGGITPAYAGKSRGLRRRRSRSQDHPRICGEKIAKAQNEQLQQGSPPHMRGKDGRHKAGRSGIGITPAYAGKRTPSRMPRPAYRDHPRICGEKGKGTPQVDHGGGSPPHMRGKEHLPDEHRALQRITPAYAGKRLKRSRSTVPPVAIVPLFPSVCNKPVVSDGSPAGRDAPLFLPAENAVPASPAYNLRSL